MPGYGKRSNPAVCKTDGSRLRRFESYSWHHAEIAQLIEHLHGKQKVTGLSPVLGSTI